jgi:hypothetical protein
MQRMGNLGKQLERFRLSVTASQIETVWLDTKLVR